MKYLVWLFLLATLGVVCDGARAVALFDTSSGQRALVPKTLDVQSEVEGAFSQTRVTTTYSNPNTERIEAQLLYTAPREAVVIGFAYWYLGEKVVARIETKERAERIYNLITTRQRDPALVELLSQNSFRAKIFPVMPGQDLKIEVSYVLPLDSTSEGWQWKFPLRSESTEHLQKVSLRTHFKDAPKSGTASAGRLEGDTWTFDSQDVQNLEDVTLGVPLTSMPLRVSITCGRGANRDDGFFALSVVPSSVVAEPRLQIKGLSTFDVLAPKVQKLDGGERWIVTGRFKQSGEALVSVGNRSVKVRFDGTVVSNSIAEKLWAQAQMTALSSDDVNGLRVIELSKRFGIPSKWTSWLAIPQAERDRYQAEYLRDELNTAANLLAQAIAQGEPGEIKKRRRTLDTLQKSGGKNSTYYFSGLQSFLDAELARVKSEYEGLELRGDPRAKQWKVRRTNLEKAGARDRAEQSRIAADAFEKRATLARQIVPLIEAGQTGSARFKTLKKRYDNETARQRNSLGYEPNSPLRERANERAQFVAVQYQRARYNNDKAQVVARLRTRAERLIPYTDWAGNGRTIFLAASNVVFGPTVSAWDKKVAAEIAAKRENGRDYVRFRSKLDYWHKRSGLVENRWATQAAWSDRIRAVTSEMQTLIEADNYRSPRYVVLQREIVRLQKRAGYFNPTYANAFAFYLNYAINFQQNVKAAEILAEEERQAPPAHVEAIKTEIRYLSSLSNDKELNKVTVSTTPQRAINDISYALSREIVKTPEESARSKRWRELLEVLHQHHPDLRYVRDDNEYRTYQGPSELWRAERGRAHESAYRLLEAKERSQGVVNVTALEAELEARAKVAGKPASAFLNVEEQRRRAGEPFLTAEQYLLKPGDPLISVKAPHNSRRVVAILPSGEILPLTWNARTLTFEARFDVPTHALPGPYTVQVVVVDQSGARHQLSMRFSVEEHGPDGRAQLFFNAKDARLQLECDSRTDRVSAFFESGERIELARESGGLWSAALPPQLQTGTQVRFVLTDAAHNRTEITLDLKEPESN